MTICLGVLADNGRAIITVSDTKLSCGTHGGKAEKMAPIHRDWQILWAGHASPCANAIDTLRLLLDHHPKSRAQMVKLVTQACQENPCQFGEDRTLLLVGFDETKTAHLCVLEDDQFTSTPLSRTHTEYQSVAIGTGADMATFVLSMIGAGQHQTVAESLYSACVAKFYAEGSDGVNRLTRAYILRPGYVDLRPLTLHNRIRKAWKREGQLPIPKVIIKELEKALT